MRSPIQDYHVEKHTIYCICEDLSECTVTFRQLMDSRLSEGDKLHMVVQDDRRKTDGLGYTYIEPNDIDVWRTVPDWLEQEDRETVLNALERCAYGPQDLRCGDLAALDSVKEILIYNQYK